MKKLFISMLPDLLMLVGAGALSYGAWLIYPAAGYLVAGALLMIAGVMAARVK